ncbi:hypothetical protein Goarm_021914, partial [Gossypium armourianum]|nr:hypothetical protein [Gossypium armourianum]
GETDSKEPLKEEYIELLEGDVLTQTRDGIPSIKFFERVHSLMDKSMSETVIIKLLRRKTGVNALLNKIYSIEKPSTSIQLTELN